MKVKDKGNSQIIKQSEESVSEFITKIQDNYKAFQNFNLIIELSNEGFDICELSQFEKLNEQHKKNKKSFVLVFEDADFNEVDEQEIILVPSVQEALDIIEMEEIERDLGF